MCELSLLNCCSPPCFFSLCACILLSDSGEVSHFLKHYDFSGGGGEMLANGGLRGSCSREAGQNHSTRKLRHLEG